VLIDNGVMRLNECQQVKQTLEQHLGINLEIVDGSERFLNGLAGVTDPEKKRKFIGGCVSISYLPRLKHYQKLDMKHPGYLRRNITDDSCFSSSTSLRNMLSRSKRLKRMIPTPAKSSGSFKVS
jgi:hypothetical protein